jgi:hypothetical protein
VLSLVYELDKGRGINFTHVYWFNDFIELTMNRIRMPSFGYMIDGVDYRDPKYGLK